MLISPAPTFMTHLPPQPPARNRSKKRTILVIVKEAAEVALFLCKKIVQCLIFVIVGRVLYPPAHQCKSTMQTKAFPYNSCLSLIDLSNNTFPAILLNSACFCFGLRREINFQNWDIGIFRLRRCESSHVEWNSTSFHPSAR
jgi:hypothetical protein